MVFCNSGGVDSLSLVNLDSFYPIDKLVIPVSQDKGKLAEVTIVFPH